MARRRRPTLIAEIGRLFIEYPAKDWKLLADHIRDPALIDDIVATIEQGIAHAAKATEKTKEERPKRRVSRKPRVLPEDEAKAKILTMLKSRLADKTLTPVNIREFASLLGMKEKLATHRERAGNQIIRYLANKSTEEIEAALRMMLPVERPVGQEFDRWVSLILGDEAKARTQEDPDVKK